MGKIAKDTPLSEITLRKYESPTSEGRELIRKLCLSLGLLQPGDSRDVVVDVFQVILDSEKPLTSTEIEKLVIKNRKEHKQPLIGIAPSNIRRQILRIRDLFFVEKNGNYYKIREDAKLSEIFQENIENYFLNSIVTRVKEYLDKVDSRQVQQ